MNTAPSWVSYAFYIALLIISGVGEYFHIIPANTTAVILGGILGHGVSAMSSAQGASQTANTNTKE